MQVEKTIKDDAKRIAITGIDGSGKSTVTRHLLSKLPAFDEETVVIRCPTFHEIPNAPFSSLSKDLDALSKTGDLLESFELKAMAQFIQISLFGPVERFMVRGFSPKLIINERHPIIDAYAYGYFYLGQIGHLPNQKKMEPLLIETLEGIREGAYTSIEKWLVLEGKRLGMDLSLWNYQEYLLNVFSLKKTALVRAVKTHTRGHLPDMLLFLDVGEEVAVSRVEKREEPHTEMHEKSDMLRQIRHLYFDALDFFSSSYPEMETRIITLTKDTNIDKTIDEIVKYI